MMGGEHGEEYLDAYDDYFKQDAYVDAHKSLKDFFKEISQKAKSRLPSFARHPVSLKVFSQQSLQDLSLYKSRPLPTIPRVPHSRRPTETISRVRNHNRRPTGPREQLTKKSNMLKIDAIAETAEALQDELDQLVRLLRAFDSTSSMQGAISGKLKDLKAILCNIELTRFRQDSGERTEELKSQTENLQQTIDSIQDSYAKQLEADNHNLKKTLDNTTQCLNQYKATQNDHLATIARLESSVRNLENIMQERDFQLEQISQIPEGLLQLKDEEIALLTEKSSSLEESLLGANLKLQERQAQYESQNAQNLNLIEKLSLNDKLIESLQAQVTDSSHTEMRKLHSEIKFLRDKIIALEKALESAKLAAQTIEHAGLSEQGSALISQHKSMTHKISTQKSSSSKPRLNQNLESSKFINRPVLSADQKLPVTSHANTDTERQQLAVIDSSEYRQDVDKQQLGVLGSSDALKIENIPDNQENELLWLRKRVKELGENQYDFKKMKEKILTLESLLDSEQKKTTLLAAELEALPDFIEMYHYERNSLINRKSTVDPQKLVKLGVFGTIDPNVSEKFQCGSCQGSVIWL